MMSRRSFESSAALATAIATAALLTVSVAGQAQKPAQGSTPRDPAPAAQALSKAKAEAKTNRNYKAPRTGWGEPDLQGVWSYATTTPLSKPDSAGDRTVLTDQEVEELAERAAAQQDAAPRAGDPGTYNNFWW